MIYKTPRMILDDYETWCYSSDTDAPWICAETVNKIFNIPKKAIGLQIILHDTYGKNRWEIKLEKFDCRILCSGKDLKNEEWLTHNIARVIIKKLKFPITVYIECYYWETL